MASISDRRKVFIYVSNGYTYNPFAESRYEEMKKRYDEMDPSAEPNPEEEQTEEQKTERENLETAREEEFKKKTQFTFADLTNDLGRLVREAQRANVTFYPIDPRGLIATGDTAEMRIKISYADWRDYFTTQINSLKVMADETGGFCLCETNDFEGGLRRIDAETSDFYRIGYTSSNPDPLKTRRSIRIEVARPGIEELIYRKEYTIPKPNQR